MNIQEKILKLPLVQKLILLSKRIILPGFQGVSLYEAGTFFRENMSNVNLADRCSAVTYNFLTALPP
ncbi:MAG: hypothetical protein JNL13_01045, partial [Chitinophagaceae bacterium]|nr:hypothetical protein [Chitinophagaceae bacterium]